ncbi:hypothetical protein JYT44_02720 [Caldithrix abyssi]|nr:hypothetical protein [Caldithrix abyssi]
MGHELRRWRKRKTSLNQIDAILENEEYAVVIHYACEKFFKDKLTTSRITSVAIRNLASGQTESFSLNRIAEQKRISFVDIGNHYDELERELLNSYFKYLDSRRDYTWVHWNMRDMIYGFAALEHRYKCLGGEPISIDDSKKFDVHRALINIYGYSYISSPALENLLKINNNISMTHFLPGLEEAEAFENKEYVRLHQSTLRKINAIVAILHRIADRTIKTDISWYKSYGTTLAGITELVTESWAFKFLGIITIVFGVVLGVVKGLKFIF